MKRTASQLNPERNPPTALPELSRVRLRRSFPEAGVTLGECGTIVHAYADGGYEVEIVAGRTRPTVVTVEADDVEAVAFDE